MGKAILLTGDPGVGKTTLLKRIIRNLGVKADGFYTREIREKGSRVGFEIVTLQGEIGTLAHVDNPSKFRVGRYGVDLSALESIGVDAIHNANSQHWLAIIDEIGPMEIFSKNFCQVVMDTLTGDTQLFGTIVKRKNPFSDRIKQMPHVKMVDVTLRNRNNIQEEILEVLCSADWNLNVDNSESLTPDEEKGEK